MILVVGAGKLGGLILKEFEGFDIDGTKTTKQKGFIKLDLETDKLINLKYDTFIFCVPPSALKIETWLERIQEIKHKKIIFISSTGIYGNNKGKVSEDTIPLPNTENGHKLFAIEKELSQLESSFIIRPSGLFSIDSHPGYFLSGKSNLKNGNDPINLISRKDVSKVVKLIYELETPRLINLSNPNHPIKSLYYKTFCIQNKIPLPIFQQSVGTNKIVTSNYDLIENYIPLP